MRQPTGSMFIYHQVRDNVGTSSTVDRELGLNSSSRLNRKQPTKQKSEKPTDNRECPSTSKRVEYEVPADPDK